MHNAEGSIKDALFPYSLKFQDRAIPEWEATKYPCSASPEFLAISSNVRKAIDTFVRDAIQNRCPVGLSPFDQGLENPPAFKVLRKSLQMLARSLDGIRFIVEESSLLSGVLPHIQEQLRTVQRYIPTGQLSDINNGEMEPFAYDLLDLKSLLTVTSLEIKSREINALLEKEITPHEAKQFQGGLHLISVKESKVLTKEFTRHGELHREVLPLIQERVGSVVQVLIPFLSELRERAPAPFGFIPVAPATVPLVPPDLAPLTSALKAGSYSLERIYGALGDDTGSDLSYKSVLNGLAHHMDLLRVSLLRQHYDGLISERDIPVVQRQCEKALRDLTAGLRYLNQMSTEPFIKR